MRSFQAPSVNKGGLKPSKESMGLREEGSRAACEYQYRGGQCPETPRPPIPSGVRSPFVASAALELEGERSLQKEQEVEQREQPVPRLLLHHGHSPDPDERMQKEQQPGDQGVEQDQSLHAGALCPRPSPSRRPRQGHPTPPVRRNLTAPRPAATVVPPQPPAGFQQERATRPSPKLPENSSKRGASKPSFSRLLGFPGSLGLAVLVPGRYSPALPNPLPFPGARLHPCPLSTPASLESLRTSLLGGIGRRRGGHGAA